MINNLTATINSDSFKSIKGNIESVQEFIDTVIPKGYEHLIQVMTDGIDVMLRLVSDDESAQYETTLKRTVYNPDRYIFPTFYLTDLATINIKLNQNQLVHLLLINRFEQFKPMKNPYLNLINKDFQEILRYIQYQERNTFNSKIKFKNLNAIFYFKDMANLANDFESVFYNSAITEAQWKTFFTKNNVLPSSIGGMSKSSTITMNNDGNIKYRAPAYSQTKDGFTCIFPHSQNIPARLQGHLLNDALELSNPSVSIIQQDNLIVDGKLIAKDRTMHEVITVFHPIDMQSCRFMAGEIEISADVSDEEIIMRKNIEDNFDILFVEVGKTYYPNEDGEIVLGMTVSEDEIVLEDFKSITINSIKNTSVNGSKKINYSGVKRAGNARLISNTGVKGVSKTVSNTGTIYLNDYETELNDVNPEFLKNLERRYPKIDVNTLDEYPKVITNLRKTLKPDIVLGMNSAKAKSNTIVLAGACLAVKLGYYKPSTKFGFENLLNSLDPKEINDAYNSLPEFTYVDMYGNEQHVHIGITYIQYTELGEVYTRLKPQAFSFESGRFLATDTNPVSKELYQHIWNNYLEKDKVEAVKELYEIYLGALTNTYQNPDNLPVYNLDQINELFDSNDLVLSKRLDFPTDSKLLDENFNKGFFIDLSRYKNAPIIRIPSAKTLKLYSGVLKNGNIIYHVNVINVSKILRGCFKTDKGYALNTVYSKDPNRYTSALAYHAYINTIRSTIYSGPDESQQLIQTLIKPRIMGCNLKQVSESTLPKGVIVIPNRRIYNKLHNISLEGSDKTLDEHHVKIMYLMQTLDLTDKDKAKELFKEINKDCPLALCVRNPS